MREIVLDTETTGLDPATGDRIVEIGAVELVGHMPTGRTYHQYVNPERTMPPEAFEVHGLGDEFLSDKPKFAEIAQALLEFLGDARLVIHNASFDLKFLNAELRRAGFSPLAEDRAIDTLLIARQRFPGSPGSLDALCRRFGIDNTARTLHGALLDSEILAEVYLELVGGRQPDFGLSQELVRSERFDVEAWTVPPRPRPLPSRLTEQDCTAHAALVEQLGPNPLWKSLA